MLEELLVWGSGNVQKGRASCWSILLFSCPSVHCPFFWAQESSPVISMSGQGGSCYSTELQNQGPRGLVPGPMVIPRVLSLSTAGRSSIFSTYFSGRWYFTAAHGYPRWGWVGTINRGRMWWPIAPCEWKCHTQHDAFSSSKNKSNTLKGRVQKKHIDSMRTPSVPPRLPRRLNVAFIETSICRHHLFWAEKWQRSGKGSGKESFRTPCLSSNGEVLRELNWGAEASFSISFLLCCFPNIWLLLWIWKFFFHQECCGAHL